MLFYGNLNELQIYRKKREKSPSRDLNTGPADYKSAALPTKPLRRHMILSVDRKKVGALFSPKDKKHFYYTSLLENTHSVIFLYRSTRTD